jgi:hypothetical protein
MSTCQLDYDALERAADDCASTDIIAQAARALGGSACSGGISDGQQRGKPEPTRQGLPAT